MTMNAHKALESEQISSVPAEMSCRAEFLAGGALWPINRKFLYPIVAILDYSLSKAAS